MTATRQWTVWLLLLAVLSPALSHAGEGKSAQRAYRRATTVAVVGGVATFVGPALVMGGITVGLEGPEFSPPGVYELGLGMYVGGFAAFGSGGALMAGGSLAARKVLVRHGVRVSAVPGSLAWATWAVAASSYFVLPAFADFPGAPWVALSASVATLGLGTWQLVLDHEGARRLREDAVLDPMRVTIGLAPTVTPDRVGMAVVASF